MENIEGVGVFQANSIVGQFRMEVIQDMSSVH
jgi:hypothetical protein